LPWPQEDSLSGDLSGDGSVNLVDLVMLMQEWLATGVNAADIAPGNGDGVVNLEDFSELVSQMEGN
ncbi:MAG: hypothetical protein JW709_02545, partial [Sedimentisphaerales bacterium]|nr:hypothetical protein [Sedimentisphaerales bacterium]